MHAVGNLLCRVLADNRSVQTITLVRVFVQPSDWELTISRVSFRGFDFQVSQAALVEVWREGAPKAQTKYV